VNPWEAETELEEMLVGVLLAFLPFLSPILGNDLVVVSRREAMGRMSRQRREANLAPRHKIEIQAEIRSRYASTLVTHTVENTASEAKEVVFNLLLPDTAFVSRFAMVVGGEVFLAEVEEKKKALETYNEAVSKGQSAGHVALSARDSNQFSISANAEAGVKVEFHLLYEELLQRRSGQYIFLSKSKIIPLSPRFVSLPSSPQSTTKPPISVLGSHGGGTAQPYARCSAHHKGQQPGRGGENGRGS
jgi:hypothetical protein